MNDGPLWREPDDPEIGRFKAVTCPWCGYPIDAAMDARGSTALPTDGDFGLCVKCASPHCYVVNAFGVSLRRPTADEAAEFEVDHGDARQWLEEIRARRGQ